MNPRDIKDGVRRLFLLDIRRPEDALADGDAELESLLDEQVLDLTRGGMSLDAARAEAVRRLGPSLTEASHRLRQSAQQRERRMKLHEWFEDAVADCHYAVRTLGRSPALAGTAILTLALAIGANTAIFSVVSAVILRPLPYADPARLVMVWEENPEFGWYQEDAAPANMLDWKEQVGAFSSVAAYPSFPGTTTLTGFGEPRLLRTQEVTGNFFDVLGVRAAMGRTFVDAETWETGGPPTALLSFRAWRDVFGRDSAMIGRSVVLNGRAWSIVGVLPEQFTVPGIDTDVWKPVQWDPADRTQVFFRRAHWLKVIARLKPDVTPAGANAELQSVVKRLQRDYPATNRVMGAGMTPLHEFLIGKTKRPLLVMFGAVAVLLLIACANVANLLLVRAAGRARETALRLALGAGRGRLLRQALAESAVLSALGGAAGLALGWWGTGALRALQPRGMLPVTDIPMNWSVLLYVSLACGLCAVFFGLAPTLWSGQRVPADVLRDEGRAATGVIKARRWADVLLGSQVALALTLTLGAGLLVRSYLLLQRVEPGFDPHNVLTVRLALPGFRYDSASKVLAFYETLEREARAFPGVEAAAVVSKVPLGPPSWTSQFAVAGREPLESGKQVLHREISLDYHQVMRVPVVRGRVFTTADRGGAPAVVLINEAMARTYFQGQDPVGQRIAFDRVPDSNSVWRTIVGVVGDERQNQLSGVAEPEFYAPFAQDGRHGMILVVRTRNDPNAIIAPVRRVISRLDPALAISGIRTMEEVRSESLSRDRFVTTLMLVFAGVGLVLGLVGVYGVVAQVARRRTREMGIRVALGAKAREVQWLVVRHGLGVTAAGIGVGLTVALGTTGTMRSLLYEVAPVDPVVFVVVPALVLVIAALASWLPARRASRADPCEVLRGD